MNDSIIAGLITAAISGLSFLAYKHQDGFRKLLALFLFPLICIYVFLIASTSTGIHFSTTHLFNEFKSEPTKTLNQVSHLVNLGYESTQNMLLLIIGGILVAAYITLMLNLPKLTNNKKK